MIAIISRIGLPRSGWSGSAASGRGKNGGNSPPRGLFFSAAPQAQKAASRSTTQKLAMPPMR
jgi:hypothetical protein